MAVSFRVIGGGQMARALVGGMIDSEFLASELSIVDPNRESLRWWAENHPDIKASANIADDERAADVVLIAVKPNVVEAVATSLKLDDSLVISIAAGVSLRRLCKWVDHQRVVRVMPNTPALVGAGASAYCSASDVTSSDRAIVERMLGAVGTVHCVSEDLINAVTGLSGSGPAYVYLIIEAMADGGVAAGLPRQTAMQLAAQTVMGAAKMVIEDGRHPGQLKDAVASPGGTTIAGVASLERDGIRAAMIDAVLAAKNRADQM